MVPRVIVASAVGFDQHVASILGGDLAKRSGLDAAGSLPVLVRGRPE